MNNIRIPCDMCDTTGRIEDKRANQNVPPFRPQLCKDCGGTGFKLANKGLNDEALLFVIVGFAIFAIGMLFGIAIG